MSDVLCVVCLRRKPARGLVCDPDRTRLAERLGDLPRQIAALSLSLVPAGGAAHSERVRTSRTGSPTGARLDVLTLTGPGNPRTDPPTAVTGMLHPQVRKWQATETVVCDDGTKREITVWHQELVRDADGCPVQTITDDQVGLLPPREWLELWVRRWREHFGHSHRRPGGPLARGASSVADLGLAARRHAAHVLLGLTRGYNGAPVLRTDDPIAEEWELRYGEPAAAREPAADVAYLLGWLDHACDQITTIDEFAAELRALSSELGRVLGEQPDQQWLGRCPTTLTNRETGQVALCGAGLWQDPYASQVACPRCRSTWGPGGPALLRLAADIRQAWPVDRRRRYTLDEVAALRAERPLRCPTCASVAFIDWREATAPGDPERTWRPHHAYCPMRCPAPERLI
jgi:hypothetical protein